MKIKFMEYVQRPGFDKHPGNVCCNVCLFCLYYIILLTTSLHAHPQSFHSISALTQVCFVWFFQASIYTSILFSPSTCFLGSFTKGHSFCYVLLGYKFLIFYLQRRPHSVYHPGFFVSLSPSVNRNLWSSYAPKCLFHLLRVPTAK